MCAAALWLLAVLQIEIQGPVSPRLLVLTLPDKIRHGEITEIQVAISVIPGDRTDLFHDCIDDARRNDEASFVVKQHILISVSIVWASDLADGVQWARDVCNVPSATHLTMLPFKGGHALAELLDNFSSCA
jgi:hypothetical protein